MPTLILNEILKFLIIFTIFWSIFNLYLAIYFRVRAIKKSDLFALSQRRLKDFFEGLVFLLFFWTYIVVQVYLHGIGILETGLQGGNNVICIGIRFETICLGKEEILTIDERAKIIRIEE